MATGNNESDLSAFQLELARLFFALPASEAGPCSGSMTATRSAGWSSAVPMPGSWLTWPCPHRRTFLPPRPQPGQRSQRARAM